MILQSLIIALSMYSAIPMPRVDWREDNMRWSLGCLPVVGVLIGGLLAGWSYAAARLSAQPVLFAAVAVALPLLLSGGFHMDGFLDAADGIFSRRDRERRLAIMKDPHCGPFAVFCCGGLLVLELGAWCQLLARPVLLPAACAVFTLSRSFTVVAGSRLPYASSSTLGALFAGRASRHVGTLGLAELLVSAGGFLLLGYGFAGWAGLAGCGAALAAACLLFWRYAAYTQRAFGGVTGDLLGFLVELSQMALLLMLALASLFIGTGGV